MLQMPRMKLHKSFTLSPVDQKSFLSRICDAFKDFPDDQKPLITHMGLPLDGEWIESEFGLVPKGSPLSYQCPLPSSKDYQPHENAPPQPMLPSSYHTLDCASDLPKLSAKEQEYVTEMQVTWEEAQELEQATRFCEELKEKHQKRRLTSRFKDICLLKPGRSHAEHLLYKIKKGPPVCKTTLIDSEMKPEALREYCRHMCVNWSPCGLVVHPSAPWLGVTPDGLVYDPKEKSCFGLVRIKIVSLPSFTACNFLDCKNGDLQLKKTTNYYWQIQGEMMVTGTSWCDLLVHCRDDMLVQRLYRDDVAIEILKNKLKEFFFYYYLPGTI